MKKYIITIEASFLMDARNRGEAEQVAQEFCDKKGFTPKHYHVREVNGFKEIENLERV